MIRRELRSIHKNRAFGGRKRFPKKGLGKKEGWGFHWGGKSREAFLREVEKVGPSGQRKKKSERRGEVR